MGFFVVDGVDKFKTLGVDYGLLIRIKENCGWLVDSGLLYLLIDLAPPHSRPLGLCRDFSLLFARVPACGAGLLKESPL